MAPYDWPQAEAVEIGWCESTGDPDADNQGAVGLFGVEASAHPDLGTAAQLKDPERNVWAAYQVYERNAGWRGPWAYCSTLLD